MDLLRWFRFTWAAGFEWDRASQREARDFSRWLQLSGRDGKGYAPAVRAHSETVLRGFYAYHLEAGTGPVINPFPLDRARRRGRSGAHHNPMENYPDRRSGRYRPRLPSRVPRAVSDDEFNAIFARLPSNRDRALVAFCVSTGARASELLSATAGGTDPGRQLITVVRKGTRELAQLPAPPDAFVWLRLYQAEMGTLARNLERTRDLAGLARLRDALDESSSVAAGARHATIGRAAAIMAAKGGTLAEIAAGDFLELLDAERGARGRPRDYSAVSWRLLRQAGAFGPQAPESLAPLLTIGQRSPAELIDRYQLAGRTVRDLIVDYLQERQPALDYRSLDTLAQHLGRNFWADLERHHPGIASLNLPAPAAAAWKQRMRTRPEGTGQADGQRLASRHTLMSVRAFYLDLACWAAEDRARWGQWAVPGPVSKADAETRKEDRRRKSRMDSRTRERLPVLPVLARSAAGWRDQAAGTLKAALAVPPGAAFTAGGHSFTRTAPRKAGLRTWAHDSDGTRHDLTWEEDHAFWAWAIIEVLRATGVRAEELLELTHHSLIQYRLPSTGELVPLLQIAPSKTDTERLLVVSPDLADVPAAIITRLAGPDGKIPLTARYDEHEHVWQPPAPLLFQRRSGAGLRHVSSGTIQNMLNSALGRTGLADAAGQPLIFTPHDFRRMFITDAIMTGLPPHIAQVIAGHPSINVTMGYKATYPEEIITHHQAFIARRRALRPTDEYRTPTDKEWEEFLGHFERRKLSVGNCGRAFATPCIHEHACVRCPMLWPDPAQRPRLAEIRDNLTARIAEAEREGRPGEIEGLQISLAGASDKLAQIDRRGGSRQPVDIGFPAIPPRQQPKNKIPVSS